MSDTNHRRNLRRDGAFRYGPSTSRLTRPGWTTPVPSRVPPNQGGPAEIIWSARDARKEAALMKRHGRRVERQRGNRQAKEEQIMASLYSLDFNLKLTGEADEAPPKLYALVIACRLNVSQKERLDATIVNASRVLLEDIMEALSSRDADESLGMPPKAGIWIWEGIMKWTGSAGDYDVDYVGTYREITEEELHKLRTGEPLDWFDEPEDPSDEEREP